MNVHIRIGEVTSTVGKVIVWTLVVGVILFGISLFFLGYWNPQTKTITVKDKFMKAETYSSDSGSKIKDVYMIVDTDNNTYQITDLFWIFKFNSTDIYNTFEVGKTYEINTTGFRIRFFSSYPNINKVQLLEE